MQKTTQFHIRPARPEEAGLFYTPHPEEDKRLGTVGHVRMDFGRSGNEFWHAPSTQIVITEAIRVLRTVEASRDAILTQMQALAKTLPEYSLVREMPCIGDTLAPRLIAEIGDVRRFHSKRALIAYAGIDAPPYQSGKFCANNRHISFAERTMPNSLSYW